MIEKIKALCVKYREFLVYFIVGCLTTLVAAAARFGFNFLFFGGTLHPTFAQNTALAIVDWVAGVAFAYPTNRKWVFQSKNPNILAEAGLSLRVSQRLGWTGRSRSCSARCWA